MNRELQDYYENRFSMMATEGWKELIEDAEELHKSLNNVLPIQTEQELHLKRGQLDILNWIINLKGMTERAYESLLSGDSDNG